MRNTNFKDYFHLITLMVFPILGFIGGIVLYFSAPDEGIWILSKDLLVISPFVLCPLGFGVGFLIYFIFDFINKRTDTTESRKRKVLLKNAILALAIILNLFLMVYSTIIVVQNWSDIYKFWSQISDDLITGIIEFVILLFFYPISVLFRDVFDPSLRTLYIILLIYGVIFVLYLFSNCTIVNPSDRVGYTEYTLDGDTGAVLNKKEVSAESIAIKDNIIIGICLLVSILLLPWVFFIVTTVLAIKRLVKNIRGSE